MRRNMLLISVAAMLVLAAPSLAQDLGGQSSGQDPVMETIGLLGKGIASLPSDPTDFGIVKVGVAKVRVTVNETETKVLIGILTLDDQKYRIRDVVVDNGSVTGNLYLNDTQAGSISVKSIMKGNIEVWAGTLTVEGKTYNVHILGAPRLIKKAELKEKIKDYCNETGEGNCSAGIENYCESNPTDTRCMALFKAFCVRKNNMDDTRCREFMLGWCKDNPENQDCRLLAVVRSAKYCADNPDTPTCTALVKKLADYCSTDPGNAKCNETCREHPEACKSVVRNLAEFCLENANHTDCLQYCRTNPKACVKLAANLVATCIQNPNRAECMGYCKEHPAACKIVSAELAKFCITNQDNEKCKSFCESYPDSCRKVTERIEGYCSGNSTTAYCSGFCRMYPKKCATPQPVEVEVETAASANLSVGVS